MHQAHAQLGQRLDQRREGVLRGLQLQRLRLLDQRAHPVGLAALQAGDAHARDHLVAEGRLGESVRVAYLSLREPAKSVLRSGGPVPREARAILLDTATGIDLPVHERRVGYVFQDLRLFPHLDVLGNLRYGLRGNVPVRFDLDDVVDLLGIGALLDRRTANLSGGEAQRVAIGRALLSQPSLLLLDEPLSSLDRARRDELLPYLRRLRDDVSLPMVVVSHHDDGLRTLADAVHAID